MLKNIWTPIHHINLCSSINNINGIFIEWHQSIHIAMETFHKCVIFRLDEIQYLQSNLFSNFTDTNLCMDNIFVPNFKKDVMNFVSSSVFDGTFLFEIHWLNIFCRVINYFWKNSLPFTNWSVLIIFLKWISFFFSV